MDTGIQLLIQQVQRVAKFPFALDRLSRLRGDKDNIKRMMNAMAILDLNEAFFICLDVVYIDILNLPTLGETLLTQNSQKLNPKTPDWKWIRWIL